MEVVEKEIKTAILIGAGTESREELLKSLNELKLLADTAGIETLDMVAQSFKEKTKATYIGSGKVEEIAELIKEKKPTMVIVDELLKGFQLRNLSEAFGGIEVVDRYMLILDIFAQRAKTNEGKVQVEIAQMKYNMSRISLIKESDNHVRGGFGSKGSGESKVEMEKRIFRNKLKQLEEKVEDLKKQREISRQKRKQNQEKMVAIVGYTNAGKSTLLNAIAKENIYADNKLFATLDTTTRKIYLDYKHSFLLTDTVGFINKLPHDLVEAFQATLEEVKNANCILHVVDASDKQCFRQMDVTNGVLNSLGVQNVPTILVLNKVDECENLESFNNLKHIEISAKNGKNLEELKKEISKVLFPDFEYYI